MVLLILESLGSTELFFILVMALVFFGPRKLPQIGRTLGKTLADFRRASEDFKRTWDKEVSLEELSGNTNGSSYTSSEQSPILNNETAGATIQAPAIGSIDPEQVIARQSSVPDSIPSGEVSENGTGEVKHSPKSEWL